MRSRALGTVGILALLVWAAEPESLEAQLAEGFAAASFQFNLSNPGARSLGMGGAFAGLADDATAAYANPAGLTVLTRPEVSVELRDGVFAVPFLETEPIFTDILERGRLVGFESDFTLSRLGEPDAGESAVSFASLVYPGRRWTLALYRHQLAGLAGRVEDVVEAPQGRRARSFTLDMDIVGHGLAGAFRPHERLSIGAGLVRYDASIEARRESSCAPTPPELRCGLQRARDSSIAVNVGLLVQPTERWRLGAVYRQGPTFDVIEGEVRLQPDGSVIPDLSSAAPFRAPHVLGLGVSFRTLRVLLTLEWDRITYSRLSRQPSGSAEDWGRFHVSDAEELRLGFEYSFWGPKLAPAIRFGIWHDPEHKLRFEPRVPCPGSLEETESEVSCRVAVDREFQREVVENATGGAALRALFPAGEDELHFTAGLGVVLGSRLQLDAAFDYVDSELHTLSVSAVVRF